MGDTNDTWWRHGMETASWLLPAWKKKAVEQRVRLSVVWDDMTFMLKCTRSNDKKDHWCVYSFVTREIVNNRSNDIIKMQNKWWLSSFFFFYGTPDPLPAMNPHAIVLIDNSYSPPEVVQSRPSAWVSFVIHSDAPLLLASQIDLIRGRLSGLANRTQSGQGAEVAFSGVELTLSLINTWIPWANNPTY